VAQVPGRTGGRPDLVPPHRHRERGHEPGPSTGRPSPFGERRDATLVWTGREAIVWGGVPSPALAGDGGDLAAADGAALDPATDTWRRIAPGPLAGRYGQVAVWTGKEMIVWGGVVNPSGRPTARVSPKRTTRARAPSPSGDPAARPGTPSGPGSSVRPTWSRTLRALGACAVSRSMKLHCGLPARGDHPPSEGIDAGSFRLEGVVPSAAVCGRTPCPAAFTGRD